MTGNAAIVGKGAGHRSVDDGEKVLLALPLASQNGIDEYEGVMHFCNEHSLEWDIRLDRLAGAATRQPLSALDEMSGVIVDGEAPMGLVRKIVDARMPAVGIDLRHPELAEGRPSYVHVDSDSAGIGKAAAKALVENHANSTFAVLPLSKDVVWSERRRLAFLEAMEEYGRNAIELNPRAALGPQLLRLEKPAAVFAVSDILAAEVIAAAQKAGVLVPDDMSVIGVDNDCYICRHTRPPLASVQPDFHECGYRAAAALHEMLIGGKSVRRIVVPITGVVGRRSMEPPGGGGRLVQRALELINDGWSGSVDAMAAKLGVSRRLLDKRFRQVRGTSVLDAIQTRRYDELCRLLLTTKLTIAEICSSMNFSSQGYLSRFFRRRSGMTMAEYRRHRGTVPEK